MTDLTAMEDAYQRLEPQGGEKALSETGSVIEEAPRRVPVRQRCDVLVCGAGPAGVGAAIAAARDGAEVVLVERWAMAGGMWTAGLVNPFFECRGRGYVVADLTERLGRAGAWKAWCGSLCFDPETMKRTLDGMLTEAGVEILYYSLAADAIVLDGKVTGAIVESKAGREGILADVTIDATGDGDMAARAGCRFALGRPVDGAVQPMTLMFEIRNTTGYRQRDSRELYDQLAEVLATRGGDWTLPFERCGAVPYVIALPGPDTAAVQATHVYRMNPLDPSDLTRATIDAREQARELVSLLRELPAFEGTSITTSGASIGLRESRRVLGQYRLSIADLQVGAAFDDGICAAAFPVDIHQPAPGQGTPTHADMTMKPYEIPYRCLVPADREGLLLAGRCISGDHYAHASYRVTGTMMGVGQAAGMAAARAVRDGVAPSAVDGAALRVALRERGAKLLEDGVRFLDSARDWRPSGTVAE